MKWLCTHTHWGKPKKLHHTIRIMNSNWLWKLQNIEVCHSVFCTTPRFARYLTIFWKHFPILSYIEKLLFKVSLKYFPMPPWKVSFCWDSNSWKVGSRSTVIVSSWEYSGAESRGGSNDWLQRFLLLLLRLKQKMTVFTRLIKRVWDDETRKPKAN